MAGKNDILINVRAAGDFSELVAAAKAALAEINALARAGDTAGASALRGQVQGVVHQRAREWNDPGLPDRLFGEVKSVLSTLGRSISVIDQNRGRALAEKGTRKSGGSDAADYDPAKVAKERAKARLQEAAVQEELAGSSKYRTANERIAVARQKMAAELQQDLAENPRYRKFTAEAAIARQRQAAQLQRDLGGDDNYRKYTAQVAVARQRQTANLQEDLADSGKYRKYSQRLAESQQRNAANLAEDLAGSKKYREQTERLTVARQRQAANLQEDLADNSKYRAQTQRLSEGQQRNAANLAEDLAGSRKYREQTERLTVARQRLTANTAEDLSRSDAYRDQTVRLTAARALQTAREREGLVGTDYAKSVTRTKVADTQVEARVQTGLAGDPAYADAMAQVTSARQRQAAEIQTRLAQDPILAAQYADATVRLSTARAQQAANVGQRQLVEPEYQDATRRLAVIRQQLAAQQQAALANDPAYKEATRNLAVARQKQSADVQTLLANDENYKSATARLATARAQQQTALFEDVGYREATVRLSVARRESQAAIQQALAADPAYAAATQAAAVAREQQQADLRASLAADQRYIGATAKAANAREEQANRVLLERAGVKAVDAGSRPSGLVLPGGRALETSRENQLAVARQAAVVKRIQADEEAARAARDATQGDRRLITAAANRRLAEQELSTSIRKEERQQIRSGIASGQYGGSWLQKFQARMSGSGRLPEEFATGPEMFSQKAVTSAGYMAGGMLSGAIMFGTIQAIRDASKLQEQLVGLRGQMQALGQVNAFAGVSTGLKEIANSTGLATSEVAKFYSRLLGVFNTPEEALRQTDAAMKLAVVSGTDLNTMMEELVPVAREFNVSMADIGDTAVYIKDRFGVAEESTLHFLGEIAPMAEEAGLSLQDMGVLGGTAANSIGKSITAAGEQFAKVLPQMQANQDQIYAIFRQTPQTQKYVDPLISAFGSGETGQALKIMLQGYNELDKTQQEALIHVSGSRREWAMLNGLFSQSGKLLKDMSDAEAGVGGASGGLNRRYEQVSETLNRSIEQIQQTFKNLVEGTMSSGIGNVFTALAKGVEMVVGAFNSLMSTFNELNDMFKIPWIDQEFLSPILQIGVALAVAMKAMKMFGVLGGETGGRNVLLSKSEDGLSLSISRRAAVTDGAAASTGSDALAKQANLGATAELAAAEDVLAASKQAQVVVTGEEVAAEGAAATSKQAEAVTNAELAVSETGLGTARAAGGLFGRSPMLTRLFSGGKLFGGIEAADTAAKGMGQTVGASFLPVAGMAIAASMVVKASYDENKNNVQTASNTARESMKKVSEARLAEIATSGHDLIDQLEEKIFQEDLPATLANKEHWRRVGAKGRDMVRGLVDSGQMERFSKEMTDEQLKKLNETLNSSQAGLGAVEAAGIDVNRGLVGGLINWTAANPLMKLGPQGWFASAARQVGLGNAKMADLKREDMKKLLPVLQAESDKGNSEASKALADLNTYLESTQTSAEVRKAVNEAIQAGDVNLAIEKAGGVDQFLQTQGYYDPEGMYKTGQISRTQYIDIMRQKIEDLKKQVGKSPDAKKFYEKFNQDLANFQNMADQQIMEQVDLVKFVAGMTSFTPKTEIYARFQRAFSSLTKPGQQAQIQPMIQSQWDAFQEQLGQTGSIAEWAAKASQGIEVDRKNVQAQYEKLSKDNRSALKVMNDIAELPLLPAGWEEGIDPTAPRGPDARRLGGTPMEGKQTVDEINEKVSRSAAEQGITFKEALKQEVQRRKDAYEKIHGIGSGGKFDKVLEEIDAAADDLDNITAITSLRPDQKTIDKQVNNWQAAFDKSVINLQAAQAGTSPYVQARAEIDSANRELERLLREQEIAPSPEIETQINDAKANRAKAYQNMANLIDQTASALDNWAVVEAHGNQIATTNARLRNAIRNVERIRSANRGDENDPNLISARQQQRDLEFQQYDDETNRVKGLLELEAFDRNRDPVRAAQDALMQAEFAYSRIVQGNGGETERNAAALAIKQARRQLNDALEANLEADAELAITLLNAQQDPVSAARKAVQEATRRLQLAESQGLGRDTAEWKRLYGDLTNKRVAAIDADVANQEDIINYMLEMGQITTSEAAARLRVEAGKYEVGTKKWRDIQLRIHQLEHGGGADLQFNLPAQLGLPTFYEARRLNQGMGMGIGYQDNRNMVVTIAVNGTNDPAATAEQVMFALQSATASASVYTNGMVGV